MYTLLERRIWSGTEFSFMWPNLRVGSLYPPAFQMGPVLCPLRMEDFCPFMLWVTLPRDSVKALLHHTLETGWNFGMVSPEMVYMVNISTLLLFLQGQHFCYMLSIYRSLRFKELFTCMRVTLKHRSLLDSGHFGKIGSRMEGL